VLSERDRMVDHYKPLPIQKQSGTVLKGFEAQRTESLNAKQVAFAIPCSHTITIKFTIAL
jgi:hypothetical protein